MLDVPPKNIFKKYIVKWTPCLFMFVLDGDFIFAKFQRIVLSSSGPVGSCAL